MLFNFSVAFGYKSGFDCPKFCTNDGANPVCSTEGNTYDNECFLKCEYVWSWKSVLLFSLWFSLVFYMYIQKHSRSSRDFRTTILRHPIEGIILLRFFSKLLRLLFFKKWIGPSLRFIRSMLYTIYLNNISLHIDFLLKIGFLKYSNRHIGIYCWKQHKHSSTHGMSKGKESRVWRHISDMR